MERSNICQGKLPPCGFQCLCIDPNTVLHNKRFQNRLRSFLGRLTRDQLSLVLPSEPAASSCKSIPGHENRDQSRSDSQSTKAGATDSQHESKGVADTTQYGLKLPTTTVNSQEANDHQSNSQISSKEGYLQTSSRNANSHRSSPTISSRASAYRSVIAGTLEAQATVEHQGFSDAYVRRAFDSIVSEVNSVSSFENLPKRLLQNSDFADTLQLGKSYPGTKLLALRTSFRNEQSTSLALDRVASVLFACMRDDLGEASTLSAVPGRRHGRTSAIGNKLLAEQSGLSHQHLMTEVRGALPYYYAHEIICPGILFLLGPRTQDIWEKHFSKKRVNALARILQATEAGFAALQLARQLDRVVAAVEHILCVHIAYHWQTPRFQGLNRDEQSLKRLVENLHELPWGSETITVWSRPIMTAIEANAALVNESEDKSQRSGVASPRPIVTAPSLKRRRIDTSDVAARHRDGEIEATLQLSQEHMSSTALSHSPSPGSTSVRAPSEGHGGTRNSQTEDDLFAAGECSAPFEEDGTMSSMHEFSTCPGDAGLDMSIEDLDQFLWGAGQMVEESMCLSW